MGPEGAVLSFDICPPGRLPFFHPKLLHAKTSFLAGHSFLISLSVFPASFYLGPLFLSPSREELETKDDGRVNDVNLFALVSTLLYVVSEQKVRHYSHHTVGDPKGACGAPLEHTGSGAHTQQAGKSRWEPGSALTAVRAM